MKNSESKIIAFGALGLAAILIAGRIKKQSGVGKAERIKRRIYKEVSLAQGAGVDFTKKYPELSKEEKKALERVGKSVAWKQSKRSKESGKTYTESYYGSLRRAWNAVSGVQGIGTTYDVKDANGNVCLTWIEDAASHVERENDAEQKRQRALETEARIRASKNRMRAQRNKIDRDGMLPTAPVAPDVEKPKKAKRKEAGYDERYEFAQMVWDNFLYNKNPEDKVKEGDHELVKQFKHRHDFIADAYAKKKLRKKGEEIEVKIGDDWQFVTNSFSWLGRYVEDIYSAEKEARIKAGWNQGDSILNGIRRELLEKAKHMQVIFKDEKGNWRVISGDERYDYLDKINYVLMVRDTYKNTAAETEDVTIYPVRSFDKESDVNDGWGVSHGRSVSDRDSLSRTRTVRLIPIFDVDVRAITGVL